MPRKSIEETTDDENQGFEKVLTNFCTPGGIMPKSYSIFGLAIKDCQQNDKCVGIYEEDCDGKDVKVGAKWIKIRDFKLCEEFENILNGVLTASCVYISDQRKIFLIQHRSTFFS